MKPRRGPAPTGCNTRGHGTARLPKPAHPSAHQTAATPRGLMDKIAWVAIVDLKPFPGNPRRHPEAQIARLMRSIEQVWTNPILIDETGTILTGHGRWEAAKRLGRTEVPTLTIAGLTAPEKRAVVIADNRLPEQAVWDFDLLRGHFTELIEVDFDVELTGFSTGEIDLLVDGNPGLATHDPANDLTGLTSDGRAVSQSGDVWQLDRHRLLCGDACEAKNTTSCWKAISPRWSSQTRLIMCPSTAMRWGGVRSAIENSKWPRARCPKRRSPPSWPRSSAKPSPAAATARSI